MHATGRRRRARLLWLANIWLTGADVSPGSEIGGGLLIAHPAGVCVHCRAGEHLTIGANAGIGAPLDEGDRLPALDRSPWIGDRVRVAHHSGIFGAVRVGDDALAQPGCIATHGVPAGIALLQRRVRFRTREAIEQMRSRLAAAADQE
jgi:serine acetyltransferase